MPKHTSPTPKEDDAPLYHRMVQLAIVLASVSLIAMAISSYRTPDPDNHPGPFSCSLSPIDHGR